MHTPPSPAVARALVATAAVLWSTGGFFAKHPAFDNWPDSERGLLMAFWRALFAGLLILPAVRTVRWQRLLVPMGVCFAVMNVTYLSAISLTTAANAIWLQSTAPWWIFLVGTTLLHEKVHRRDVSTLLLGGVGIVIILVCEWNAAAGGQARPGAIKGVAFGLVSAITYASVVLFMRALRGEDTAWLVSFNHLLTAAVLAPLVLSLGVWPSGWQWLLLPAFGFFQMALPYTLFGRGLRTISSQEAAAIGLLEPVLLPLWAYLVRGEVPAWWTLAGATFILAGLVLRYWPRNEKN